jgi:hypothetical protein
MSPSTYHSTIFGEADATPVTDWNGCVQLEGDGLSVRRPLKNVGASGFCATRRVREHAIAVARRRLRSF